MKPAKFIGLILVTAASAALCTSTASAATSADTREPPKAHENHDATTSAPVPDDNVGESVLLEFRMHGEQGVKPFEAGMVVGNGKPGVIKTEVETVFVSGYCSKNNTSVTYVGSDGCSPEGRRLGALTSGTFITATPTVQPNGKVFVTLQISRAHLDALVDAKTPLGTVQLPVLTESNYSGQISVRSGESTPIDSFVQSGERWEITASVYPEVHAGTGDR